MQQGWERRYPFLDLGHAAIERLLHAAYPRAHVLEADPLTGGLRNSNYHIRLAGHEEPLVLRLYTADPAACRREAALAKLVQGRVAVPTFLYADPDADPPMAITTWAHGVKLDDLLRAGDAGAIESAAYAAGVTLASIHAVTFPVAGFFGPDLEIAEPLDAGGDGWARYIEHFLFDRRVGDRLGDDLTRRLWRLVTDNAARLEPLRDDCSLVHADFKPWNLLVRRSGETWSMAGVLDWEFSFAGSPLFDVAIFLRHEASLPPVYTRGFLAGYRDGGGHLPQDWRALSKLLDLLNLCTMLGQPGGDGALVQEVRSLVQGTVDTWDAA
jgi:aminoglycoside phosphotransferase (APT) family kinase protein